MEFAGGGEGFAAGGKVMGHEVIERNEVFNGGIRLVSGRNVLVSGGEGFVTGGKG